MTHKAQAAKYKHSKAAYEQNSFLCKNVEEMAEL